MAEEKIASLTVDGKPAADALDQIGAAAERAGEKLSEATAAVTKTETEIKKLAGSSREYNSAARLVGESTLNITKFEQAFRKALTETGDSANVRAAILQAAAAKTIGVTLDQAKAAELLKTSHADVGTVTRALIASNAGAATGMNNTAVASRNYSYALRNLGFQINDVISGLAMGQSPMQVLTQQGGQFVQLLQGMGVPLKAIFSPTGLMIGGALAAAGAISAVVMRAMSLDSQLRTLRTTAATFNTGLFSPEQLRAASNAMADSSAFSRSEALAATSSLFSRQRLAGGTLQGISGASASFATATGQGLADATNKLADAFRRGYAGVKALDDVYNFLSPREMARVRDLYESGRSTEGAATALKAFTDQMEKARQEAEKGKGFWSKLWGGITGAIDNIAEGPDTSPRGRLESARQTYTAALKQTKRPPIPSELARWREEYEQAAAAYINSVKDAENAAVKANERRAALDEKAAQETEQTYARQIAAVRALTAAERDRLEVEAAAAERFRDRPESTKEKAAYIQGELAVRAAQRAVAETKALSTAQLDAEVSARTESLNREREAVRQRRELGEIAAEDELAQTLVFNDRQRGLEEDAAREKLEIIKRSAGVQRTEIDAAERAITALVDRHATERLRDQDAIAAAAAARAKSNRLISAEGQATTSGVATDAKSEALRHAQAMGAITTAEEIANAEREIAARRLETERALIDAKIAEAVRGSEEEKRLVAEREALYARSSLKVVEIGNREKEGRLAQVREWTAPISSAMNGMVQGIFQGTLRARQIIANFGQAVVVSYANMAAQAGMKWFEQHVLMAAWDAMFGAKKVAQTAATESAVTGVKASGAAAQVGVVADGQAAETGAVVAGETAKTTAQTAGAGTGLLIKAGAALKSIAISAYEAAAGAYAAIASIPYIGPFLAPVVAAGALAAVFAFGKNILSSKGGLDRVPADGTLAELHKDETVLPASYATPMRNLLASFGGNTAAPILLPNMGPSMAAVSAAFAGPPTASLAAGSAITMPRTGLPEFLTRGPRFASQTVNNQTNSRVEKNITVAPVFQIHAIDGASVKKMIMDNRGPIAEAMAKALRDGNGHAEYVSGRR
jgi:hypothetical protein